MAVELQRLAGTLKGNHYIPLLIERLRKINPWKIILFGSYAYGVAHEQSDIDLLVILDSEEMPKTFQDNMKNKLLVRKSIWDLSEEISIDLLVYTKPMYKKFQELDSMLSREISEKGKVLYEVDNS